jgi:cytochrome o ubiquinol oxidase subunit III
MTTSALSHEHDHHDEPNDKVIYGFWVYIMTDCILFASLFATYAVLRDNTYGSIGIHDIARLPYILVQSLCLLTSGFTYGLALLGLHKGNTKQIYTWLSVTFLLGLAFIGLEYHEFAHLVANGYTWQVSAFLSAFFSLVGIHGLHVCIGLLWIVILMIQLKMRGINGMMKTRFACLGLFWDFLNIMWIFIFTIVYLMGAI